MNPHRTLALFVAATAAVCATGCVRRADPSPAVPAPSAKAAGAPVTLHVLALKAYVYREPHRQAPPSVSLPISTSVVVAADTTRSADGVSFRRIVGGPGDGGFVAQEDLGDAPPTAWQSLEQARTLLGEGKLDAAVAWGERSAALDASSREAWDLLAAIHDARGDVVQARAVYARRSRLPAQPAPVEEVASGSRAAAGEQRYIAATKLRVRASPSRTAKVVSELVLNTPVDVLGLEGDFAKVAWTSQSKDVWIVDLSADAARSAEEAAERRMGYVGADYLVSKPSTREELLARAAEAEPEGRFVEAARALERASLVTPNDGTLLGRLTRVAASAKLYPLAASAALKTVALASTPASSGRQTNGPVEMAMYFGCVRPPPLEPESACTAKFDSLGTCAPCGPASSEIDRTGNETPEELEEMQRSDEANQESHRESLAEHTKEKQQLAKETSALRRKFPSGPWVRARIQGSRELNAKGSRVFVYALSFGVTSACDSHTSRIGYDAIRFPVEARPWPDEGESLEVWATGGGYENVLYGVVAAAAKEEARDLIRGDRTPSGNTYYLGSPEDMVPKPFIAGPWHDCGCCGC
ncbi:hypothetical protein [Pyxidicoccus trucidator]|uniref:hypothetical protein n=1 Tax=Pyxidicoccus trucidator TaxID=2709662 RepID=UPI0013DB165A|nr:hypothetical protein [Pyxidicoccus trucidator]